MCFATLKANFFSSFLEEMVHVNPFNEHSPLRAWIHKWSHCLETKKKKKKERKKNVEQFHT